MYLFQKLNIMELSFAKDKFIEFPKGQVSIGPVELYERVLGRTSSMILSSWKRHFKTLHYQTFKSSKKFF